MRCIGVDLHKDQFVACVLDDDGAHQTERFRVTADGLAAFRARLRPDDRLAVEAGRNVWYFLGRVRDAVAEVAVVNPARFAPIAQSKRKTDERDALELARGLRGGYLPTVPVPSEAIRRLRELLAARDTLSKTATQCKNLGHAALARNGLADSRGAFSTAAGRARLARLEGLLATDRLLLEVALRQVEALEREVLELEHAIVRLGKGLPGLATLLQIRGLGLLAAVGILAEIGDVAWFPGARQLVGDAGLGPAVRPSSQTERRGGITKQGRRLLRTLLVQAVVAMLRGNVRTPLTDFFRRKQREKGSGKAICVTARKLLTVIFVRLTKPQDYRFLEDALYQRKLKALAAAA